MRQSSLLKYDLEVLDKAGSIIGIDEAGRGALAGPVVACGVYLEPSFYSSIWCLQRSFEINDSKKLSASRREALFMELSQLKKKGEIDYAVGMANVSEIERLNILGATKLAMHRSLEKLESSVGEGVILKQSEAPLFERPVSIGGFEGTARVLVDGNPLKNFSYQHEGIVHGDAQSLVIAMASIVAKVTRDRIMDGMDLKLPLYGFAKHKGYATSQHRQAIKDRGASTEHRPSFLKKLLAGEPPVVNFVLSANDHLS